MTLRLLSATAAASPSPAAALHDVKHTGAAAAATSPTIVAGLRVGPRAEADATVSPTVGAAIRLADRLQADATSEPAAEASLLRVPHSQSVLLTFHLDRTTVPYVAERR